MSTPFLPPADPREKVGYDIVDSPIGRLLLTGNEQALSGLFMLDGGRHQMAHQGAEGGSPPARQAGGPGDTPSRRSLPGSPGKGGERGVSPLWGVEGAAKPPWASRDWEHRPGGLAEAARQLGEYFGGGRTEFDLPLAPRGTEFQLAVWAELTRIPYGTTASYGEVARALGKSLVASRAVGLANGRNPISIIVPCHRVIGADGSMTGYGGGVERKEWLLGHEGLAIFDGSLITAPQVSHEPQGTLW
jgi:O-6-methylguanine DNA methyltransferase